VKLSVVIPAREEGVNAVITHGKIKSLLLRRDIESEIIISPDDGEPHGYGLAVRRGLTRCTGDVIAIMMADGSDDPADLVRCFHRIEVEGYDCCFGSRWDWSGSLLFRVEDYPWPKLILNRLANKAIQWLFWIDYNDVTNAFKLYRREVIEAIQPLESEQFDLTVEMPLKAITMGFKYAVIPISWTNRKVGKSKWRISELGSKYVRRVLQLWWRSL
jgi:dolichol-phosphate mannosyltransferase